jgi:hypothetical protein
VAQAFSCLLLKHKALSLNPSIAKKKRKEKFILWWSCIFLFSYKHFILWLSIPNENGWEEALGICMYIMKYFGDRIQVPIQN